MTINFQDFSDLEKISAQKTFNRVTHLGGHVDRSARREIGKSLNIVEGMRSSAPGMRIKVVCGGRGHRLVQKYGYFISMKYPLSAVYASELCSSAPPRPHRAGFFLFLAWWTCTFFPNRISLCGVQQGKQQNALFRESARERSPPGLGGKLDVADSGIPNSARNVFAFSQASEDSKLPILENFVFRFNVSVLFS